MERDKVIKAHEVMCQYQRREIDMKKYIEYMNQLLGTNVTYCSTCSALMDRYNDDFQLKLWNTVKEYYPDMVPQCPVFNSPKYNTLFWKDQFEKMSIRMVEANIRQMINEAGKLKGQSKDNMLLDIELLKQYKTDKLKPLIVVVKQYSTDDMIKMIQAGLSLREVADIVGMTHMGVSKRIKKYEKDNQSLPAESTEGDD